MMRKASNLDQTSPLRTQREEMINMIQKKREHDLKSLVIAKVGETSSTVNSKRANIQKTLSISYFMRK